MLCRGPSFDLETGMKELKESKTRTKAIKKLKKRFGGYWWVIHADVFQGKDTIDVFGICKGKFFGLEFKKPSEIHELSDMQQFVIKQINENGGYSMMVTSIKEAVSFVSGVLNQ